MESDKKGSWSDSETESVQTSDAEISSTGAEFDTKDEAGLRMRCGYTLKKPRAGCFKIVRLFTCDVLT